MSLVVNGELSNENRAPLKPTPDFSSYLFQLRIIRIIQIIASDNGPLITSYSACNAVFTLFTPPGPLGPPLSFNPFFCAL